MLGTSSHPIFTKHDIPFSLNLQSVVILLLWSNLLAPDEESPSLRIITN
jgi:hypothetical protein